MSNLEGGKGVSHVRCYSLWGFTNKTTENGQEHRSIFDSERSFYCMEQENCFLGGSVLNQEPMMLGYAVRNHYEFLLSIMINQLTKKESSEPRNLSDAHRACKH